MILFRLIRYNGDVMTRKLGDSNSLRNTVQDANGKTVFKQYYVNYVVGNDMEKIGADGPYRPFLDSIKGVHILGGDKDSSFDVRSLMELEWITFEPDIDIYGVAFGGKVNEVELPENLRLVHCSHRTVVTNLERIREVNPNMEITME